jgi:hypothetical protein
MTAPDASAQPPGFDSARSPPGAVASDAPFDFGESRAAVDRVLSRPLFFVGGYPKSGTTWLQLMLDAHPEIGCRGEGHFANRLAPALLATLRRHSHLLAVKHRSIFGEMAPFPGFSGAHARYLLVSAIALLLADATPPDARVLGEKTPDNAEHFPLLAGLFPQAKFVHLVRDVRDCVVSAWFHNDRTNPGATLRQFGSLTNFAAFTARTWAGSVGAAAAFAAAQPDRCFELRYEDLLARPRETLGPLVYFLGVDASPDLVDGCARGALFETLSGGRPRGVEDRASFFRRGVPGDWRNHLSDADARTVADIGAAAMARYGYA